MTKCVHIVLSLLHIFPFPSKKRRAAAPKPLSKNRMKRLADDTLEAVAPRTTGEYGMVSAQMRSDTRTIEQVQKELREKKRKTTPSISSTTE